MRQGVPKITAPLSRGRTKRSSHGKSFTVGMVCAILSAIFAFGGTLILILAVTSSSMRGNPSSGVEDARLKSALRQLSSTAKQQLRSVEKRDSSANNLPPQKTMMDPSHAQGLVIHTYLGDIRIHFTPELSGPESIKYITDVVMAASAKQNNGNLYDAAETINGRKITEEYKCQRCKYYQVYYM